MEMELTLPWTWMTELVTLKIWMDSLTAPGVTMISLLPSMFSCTKTDVTHKHKDKGKGKETLSQHNIQREKKEKKREEKKREKNMKGEG